VVIRIAFGSDTAVSAPGLYVRDMAHGGTELAVVSNAMPVSVINDYGGPTRPGQNLPLWSTVSVESFPVDINGWSQPTLDMSAYKGEEVQLSVSMKFSDTSQMAANGELGFLLKNFRFVSEQTVDVSHPLFILDHIAGSNVMTASELTQVDADTSGTVTVADVVAGFD